MNIIERIENISNIEELDGILYKDIRSILTNKIQIENVLFTTRVMFLNNEELIEFINKLREYGFEDMALDYVENMSNKVILDFTNLKSFNENRTKS